jgi:small-conductance mechanosensitive channel
MVRGAGKSRTKDKQPTPGMARPVELVVPRAKEAARRATSPKSKRPVGSHAPTSIPANATPQQLREALERAERRIAELEAQQAQLSDRLTWVLDTLETLIADGR